MNEVHAMPKQGKTWIQVEEEYAALLENQTQIAKQKALLNSFMTEQKII